MSCAAFLKLCNGNCTDDTAFKDACTVECEECTDCISELIVTIAIIAALFVWSYTSKCACFRGLKKSGGTVTRQPQNYSAVSQAPQEAQVIGIIPQRTSQVPATISPEQEFEKYDSNNFTPEDFNEFNKVITGQKELMTTHDGVVINKQFTILARRRGGALNQPKLF